METVHAQAPQGRRHRLLVALIVLLFGVAIYQAIALKKVQQRFDQVMGRMVDLRVAEELDLGVNTGLLLLVVADDLDFRPRDLHTLNTQSREWVDDFAVRHDVDDPIRQLLQGVLSR